MIQNLIEIKLNKKNFNEILVLIFKNCKLAFYQKSIGPKIFSECN